MMSEQTAARVGGIFFELSHLDTIFQRGSDVEQELAEQQ